MSTLHSFEDVIQKAIEDLETRPILEPFVLSDKPSTLTPVLSANRKLEVVRGPFPASRLIFTNPPRKFAYSAT